MVSPDLRPASPDSETVLLNFVLVFVIRFLCVQKNLARYLFLSHLLKIAFPEFQACFASLLKYYLKSFHAHISVWVVFFVHADSTGTVISEM